MHAKYTNSNTTLVKVNPITLPQRITNSPHSNTTLVKVNQKWKKLELEQNCNSNTTLVKVNRNTVNELLDKLKFKYNSC